MPPYSPGAHHQGQSKCMGARVTSSPSGEWSDIRKIAVDDRKRTWPLGLGKTTGQRGDISSMLFIASLTIAIEDSRSCSRTQVACDPTFPLRARNRLNLMHRESCTTDPPIHPVQLLASRLLPDLAIQWWHGN